MFRDRLIVVAALSAAALPMTIALAGGFDIPAHTIDCSGGSSASATFELSGTIGQPDASPAMVSSSFELSGGFWPDASSAACLGDTDGNDVVDVDDLVAVILDWETDGSANGGDVDGNGITDVDDLVTVILAWGVCPRP